MPIHYHLFGAKGGVGTTTVAAALALTASTDRLADVRAVHRDDLYAMLGFGGRDYPDGQPVTGNHNLTMFDHGERAHLDGTIIVNDNGTNIDAISDASGYRLLVTRGCYMALRRAVHEEAVKHIDGIILVEEPGRALGRREVADVIGKPIVATIPVKDTICRAIDAGVLVHRLPDDLRRAARNILTALPAVRPVLA